MIIRINKPLTKDAVEKTLGKLAKPKSTLKDSFGALKRGIDPMAYQNEQRDERN